MSLGDVEQKEFRGHCDDRRRAIVDSSADRRRWAGPSAK
jgi:hypothetical protein